MSAKRQKRTLGGSSSRTTNSILLDGRTRDRAVRTKHTAVAGERFEPHPAAFTIVKELAGIGRHLLGGLMTAFRAGYGALRNHATPNRSALPRNESADFLGG
jgi:hypothetical protein